MVIEYFRPKIIIIGKYGEYLNMRDMEQPCSEEESFQPIKQTAKDTAFIAFSSGTTSTPKGVLISNFYMLHGGLLGVEHNSIRPGVIVHFTSLYWISAIIFTGLSIVTASTRILAPKTDATKFLKLIEKYKVTYALISSTLTYEIASLGIDIIRKYNTSSLYSLSIGGSAIDPQQIIKMRKCFPQTRISLMYGSTETGINTCWNYLYTDEITYDTKKGSSGTVVADTQIKIVDISSGQPLGPYQKGEIRIKTPYGMTGYHNLNKPDTHDEDKFRKIGDFGYYDEDKYIYVIDRIYEMFKYRGNQVSPATIEHIILKHSLVKEVAVFGVPHPVDKSHPAAAIVSKENSKITIQEILDFISSKVSDSQRLRGGVIFLDSLPKTPSGKVERRAVRDMYIKMLVDKEETNTYL